VFKRHGQIGRPCLLGYIDKCSAPCVGRVDADEHRRIVEDFCDFLAGRTDHLIRQLERRMAKASEELEFEKAARLRDDVGALRRAMERQAVVLGGGTDADVVAFADDELEAAVQVFHVRGGRVRGQRGWVIDKVEPTDTAQLVERFLTQFYGEQAALAEASDDAHQPVPKEIIVPELPAEVAARPSGCRGGVRVSVRVAQRGDLRALAEPLRNAAGPSPAQAASRGRPDRPIGGAGGDQDARGWTPRRCGSSIDVSHVQGTNVVASLSSSGTAAGYRVPPVRSTTAAGGDVSTPKTAQAVPPLPRWTPGRDRPHH
jgi:excinuclease ABC subunit C